MLKRVFAVCAIVFAAAPSWAASYYTARLDDSRAVYLSGEAFGARGDGVADDTAAIQSTKQSRPRASASCSFPKADIG